MKTMYEDIRTDENRYIANEISKRCFSEEAKNVINLATKVWKDTLEYRPIMNEDEPSLYLNAWDAGWFQIKQVNKQFPSSNYQEFTEKFSKLKQKIANNVYKLGMLIK